MLTLNPDPLPSQTGIFRKVTERFKRIMNKNMSMCFEAWLHNTKQRKAMVRGKGRGQDHGAGGKAGGGGRATSSSEHVPRP